MARQREPAAGLAFPHPTTSSSPRSRRATSRPAACRISTGELSLALDAVVAKSAAVRPGKDLRLCNRDGTRAAKRTLDVTVPNYQFLVRPDVIQNRR